MTSLALLAEKDITYVHKVFFANVDVVPGLCDVDGRTPLALAVYTAHNSTIERLTGTVAATMITTSVAMAAMTILVAGRLQH